MPSTCQRWRRGSHGGLCTQKAWVWRGLESARPASPPVRCTAPVARKVVNTDVPPTSCLSGHQRSLSPLLPTPSFLTVWKELRCELSTLRLALSRGTPCTPTALSAGNHIPVLPTWKLRLRQELQAQLSTTESACGIQLPPLIRGCKGGAFEGHQSPPLKTDLSGAVGGKAEGSGWCTVQSEVQRAWQSPQTGAVGRGEALRGSWPHPQARGPCLCQLPHSHPTPPHPTYPRTLGTWLPLLACFLVCQVEAITVLTSSRCDELLPVVCFQ